MLIGHVWFARGIKYQQRQSYRHIHATDLGLDASKILTTALLTWQGKIESEQKLQEAQAQIKSLHTKSKQMIHDLKAQVRSDESVNLLRRLTAELLMSRVLTLLIRSIFVKQIEMVIALRWRKARPRDRVWTMNFNL